MFEQIINMLWKLPSSEILNQITIEYIFVIIVKYLQFPAFLTFGALLQWRNKLSRKDNVLVISLSVCYFIDGVDLIVCGSVILPNNDWQDFKKKFFFSSASNWTEGDSFQFSVSVSGFFSMSECKMGYMLYNIQV